MKQEKKKKNVVRLLTLLPLAVLVCYYAVAPWGFYRKVSDREAGLRMEVVQMAESYLGTRELDSTHLGILETYNSHRPLAMGYEVQPEDSWCATFVSCVAIRCGMTERIPTECGCQRQIGLFQDLGQWEESDSFVPQPGDIIYYDWEDRWLSDCTGWADHVGIVVGIKWPFAKVIEGNKEDRVAYRYILLGGPHIRGYGRPDYLSSPNQSLDTDTTMH